MQNVATMPKAQLTDASQVNFVKCRWPHDMWTYIAVGPHSLFFNDRTQSAREAKTDGESKVRGGAESDRPSAIMRVYVH